MRYGNTSRSLFALALVGLLGGAGCQQVMSMMPSEVGDPHVVQKSQEAHGKIEVAVVEDREVDDYFAQVGDRLKAAARELDAQKQFGPRGLYVAGSRSWMFEDGVKFRLVNNQKTNAVSTGGNFIYIYNGFLQECESEAELAALMAHEFGHVYCRHVHNQESGRIQREQYWQGAKEAMAKEPDPQKRQSMQRGYEMMYNVGSQWGHLGFSNKDEDDADDVGFLVYAKAGYDPKSFGVLFQNRLNRGGDDGYRAFKSDHPSLKKRMLNTDRRQQKYAQKLAAWPAEDPTVPKFRFDEIKARAAEAAAKMPVTPAFAAAQEQLNAFPSCFADKEKPATPPAPADAPVQPGSTTP